jgi:hypothetical protein
MNPNPTDPTNEPAAPDTAPASVAPEITEVPIEPMTVTSPTTPEVPVTSSDVIFPASPQPTPAPEAAAPSVPVGSGATPTPTLEPKKSNKKLIKILSAVGGVILLAVIGALLYATFSGASPEDYKEATTQYNTTSSANSSLALDVSSLNSGLRNDTDEEFNSAVKEAEDSLTKLKDENKKLGDLKAVKVGEGKDLYKTFNDKMTVYTAYAGDIIQSAKKARPGIIACEEARDTTTSTERIAGLKNCSTALVAVGDLPSDAFDAYVKSLTSIYADYAVTYEKVNALTNPLGAQYEEYKVLRDKLNASTKSLTTASKDYLAAVKAKDDEVSVKDAAQALGKFLSEQQTK